MKGLACRMISPSIQQQLLQPLVEKGTDILLVCHSFAGYSGGAAALGYSKKERTAMGQFGGIVGLVFISAFLAYEGAVPLSRLPNGCWPSAYDVDVSVNLVHHSH